MKEINKGKMKKIITIIITMCLVVSFVYYGIVRDYMFRSYSTQQKLEDFNYLCKTIETEFCFFEEWKDSYPLSFNKLKEQFITKIMSTDTDKQFFNLLNEFMIEIRDPHSYVIKPKEFWIIASNLDLKREYIGEEMYNIYNELIKSGSEDYKYWSKVTLHNYKKNKVYAYKSSGYSTKEYPKLDTIYLKVPMFTLASVEKEEIKKYLLNNTATNIILDIRNNMGGYVDDWSLYILPAILNDEISVSKYGLLKKSQFNEVSDNHDVFEISNLSIPNIDSFATKYYSHCFEIKTVVKPVDSIKRYDKLFVLVNEQCLSASEQLISWIKHSNTGTIIGSESGGIDAGYSSILTLPNTGLRVRISNTRTLFPDGTLRNVYEGTNPDIECDPEDALDIALEYIKNNYQR